MDYSLDINTFLFVFEQVIKRWMTTARRDLNNFQWRLVANAIAKCSLPIFVKLGKTFWNSIQNPSLPHRNCSLFRFKYLLKYAAGVVIPDRKKHI